MNLGNVLDLLKTIDPKEVKNVIVQVNELLAKVEALKEPGNTQKDIVGVLREIADLTNALADTLE